MKIFTLIFVIFLAQCANLGSTGEVQLASLTDKIHKIGSDVGDTVSNIGKKVKDVVETVVPSCIFGVKSVSMVLFSPDIPYGKVIAADEPYNIDTKRRVVFLVHGFISSANVTHSYHLASELVKKDYTVFSLDWSEGACTTGLPIIKFTGYPSAVANTREIGHFMTKYVISLMKKEKIPLENITFIGHSLGSHVCSFAAKKIQLAGLGVIHLFIAADPASPLFIERKCAERVCITDAERLIVLHTSSLGIKLALGHIDLYMHYGVMQPGCGVDIVCSHSRAVEYVADLLKEDCGFPGATVSTMDIVFNRKVKYPGPDTMDCILATSKLLTDDTDIKIGKYYTFVESDPPHCTNKTFSCQK